MKRNVMSKWMLILVSVITMASVQAIAEFPGMPGAGGTISVTDRTTVGPGFIKNTETITIRPNNQFASPMCSHGCVSPAPLPGYGGYPGMGMVGGCRYRPGFYGCHHHACGYRFGRRFAFRGSFFGPRGAVQVGVASGPMGTAVNVGVQRFI